MIERERGRRQPGTLGDVAGVTANGWIWLWSHSCAYTRSGAAFCWGDNASGALGTGNTAPSTSPTAVTGSLAFTSIDVTAPDTFRISGVTDDAGLRTATADAEATFDRDSAGGVYTFKIKPNIANQLRDEAVTQALQTIERRVNELGVAEPIVARQGALDQILVELPGVSDVQRAKDLIRSTALLELKIVEQGPFGTEEAARQAYSNNVPPDVQILWLPAVFLLFWLSTSRRQRYVVLTLSGYLFYGYWDWRFCFLILTTAWSALFICAGSPNTACFCIVAVEMVWSAASRVLSSAALA